jgi:hypothetical protein
VSLALGAMLIVGCGSSAGSSQSTAAKSTTSGGQPPPRFAQTVRLQPISGRVLVELPATASFVPLSSVRVVPVGTLVDTSSGAVRLTTAAATPGHLQTGEFHGGIFRIEQARAKRGLTDLRLRDAPARSAACHGVAPSFVLGFLRGTASGRFRTVGRFSAATVRGTEWGVRDRCDGTLTLVEAGVVVVHDFVLDKDITVRAGRTYLARAG